MPSTARSAWWKRERRSSDIHLHDRRYGHSPRSPRHVDFLIAQEANELEAVNGDRNGVVEELGPASEDGHGAQRHHEGRELEEVDQGGVNQSEPQREGQHQGDPRRGSLLSGDAAVREIRHRLRQEHAVKAEQLSEPRAIDGDALVIKASELESRKTYF